jgi:hypothetical protein
LPIFLLHEKLSFLRKFYFGVDFYIFNVIYLSIFQISGVVMIKFLETKNYSIIHTN